MDTALDVALILSLAGLLVAGLGFTFYGVYRGILALRRWWRFRRVRRGPWSVYEMQRDHDDETGTGL